MTRSPSSAALRYAERWPIFPCISAIGPSRKRPHLKHGFLDASQDESQIREWWARWPDALIGCPMGLSAGAVVLDVDVKNGLNGFDALEDIAGALPLPDTPVAHTATGGIHIYLDPGGREIRNSASTIGRGLDVRGGGGYIILPSPGSGYYWDPLLNFKTATLAAAPQWLTPPEPERAPPPPAPPAGEIAPYGAAAINSAVSAIYSAPCGQQQKTLNRESFGIGQLVGAGVVPESIALDALLKGAHAMPTHDRRHPWRAKEIEKIVRRSFSDGMREPRRAG